MSDIHYYEPSKGHGLKHDPFNAIVGPRPIGWISSRDAKGGINLAPYSFFNAFNYVPPIIGFSSVGWKDSVANIAETKEFCWNLATMSLAKQMNDSSGTVGPEVSEFDVAGLTPRSSVKVAAPRVAESPVTFECRVTQILQLADQYQAPVPSWMVFGEVVAVHIARHLLVEGIYDTAAAHPILRAGGTDVYVEVTPGAVFRMKRPVSGNRI